MSIEPVAVVRVSGGHLIATNPRPGMKALPDDDHELVPAYVAEQRDEALERIEILIAFARDAQQLGAAAQAEAGALRAALQELVDVEVLKTRMGRPEGWKFGEELQELQRLSADHKRRETAAWQAAAAALRLARVDANVLGWIIANGKKEGEGLAYRFIDNDAGGVTGWTPDVNKALRFARREDAEQFAHHDDDAWRMVDHSMLKVHGG